MNIFIPKKLTQKPMPVNFEVSLVHLKYISKSKKDLNLFFSQLGVLEEIRN